MDSMGGIIKALKQGRSRVDIDVTYDIFLETRHGHESSSLIMISLIETYSYTDGLLWLSSTGELGGYYPEYWEYCQTTRRPGPHSGWIRRRLWIGYWGSWL
jgi:hypothetical protein